jgi:predicted ATPase
VLSAMRRRDFLALSLYARELQEHGRRQNLPQWIAWGASLEGPALAHSGKVTEGITKIEEGLLLCERIKNMVFRPVFFAGLGEAYMLAGRFSEAAQAFENAFSNAERTEERWVNAELWRLQGELTLASKGTTGVAEAEEYFRRGIDVAKSQGSKTFELRLTMSVARLWADQRKINEARQSVADALNQVVGGRETPDPKEGYDFLGKPI